MVTEDYSCQMNQQKTNHLIPDSTLSPHTDSARPTASLFAFLPTSVTTISILFQFFPHHVNVALIQASVMDIGYYISSR
jgi:hypothetical protein